MNREKLANKTISALNKCYGLKGIIIPIDILMEISVLSRKDYENWRFGRVDYLERICHCNLSQLSYVMKILRKFVTEKNMKPSNTVYKGWGKNNKLLRFTKSGNSSLEKQYSTHYIKYVTIKNDGDKSSDL